MRPFARYAPAAWAVALGVLLLGPALGPGYLLTYDMVWVPDLALRSDFLGAGTALPRAVPSDAVVAVLDEIVGGMLLQKVVLLGALVLGGLGAATLAGPSAAPRLVATSVYVWSPFVVERLWIGHWPLLLCWAVLPWLVTAGIRYRSEPRFGIALPVLLLVGSLSANAGLMSAAALLAVGLTRRRWPALRLLALVVAANAPWVVAGLVHLGTATSSQEGAVFGLHAEGPLPAPLAALTLGGIWNAEVVPASRETVVLPLLLTVVLVVAVLAGLRPLVARLGRRPALALVGLWGVGYGLAVLSWAAPGAVGWLAQSIPGGGLLRDGGRWLALCAPLLAAGAAAGVDRLVRRVRGRAPALLIAGGAVLLPLAVLPDAAWGISGALRPVDFPDDFAAARSVLAADADRATGDLLVLPFTSYRAPAWNGGRKVLDPLPRYLTRDYLVNDELAVDGRVIAGEDPRVPRVLAALAQPGPDERAAALGRLGVGLLVRDRAAPTSTAYDAPVAGTRLLTGPGIEVVRLDVPVTVREVGAWRSAALGLAWLGFGSLVLLAGIGLLRGGCAVMARRPGRGDTVSAGRKG